MANPSIAWSAHQYRSFVQAQLEPALYFGALLRKSKWQLVAHCASKRCIVYPWLTEG